MAVKLMNTKRTWKSGRIRQKISLLERITSSPLTGEERGEGDQGFQRPLTLALSREGRGNSRSKIRDLIEDEKSTKVLLLSPALIILIIFFVIFAGFMRVAS